MKTSEGISFSIAFLSPLNQLRCRSGKHCLDSWMKNHPNGQTYLSSSIHSCSPFKALHCTAKRQDAVVTITCHFILTLIGLRRSGKFCDTFRSDKHSITNHRRDPFSINRYFSFLRYSYLLSIRMLRCLRLRDW